MSNVKEDRKVRKMEQKHGKKKFTKLWLVANSSIRTSWYSSIGISSSSSVFRRAFPKNFDVEEIIDLP
jgi:hypothetical protein